MCFAWTWRIRVGNELHWICGSEMRIYCLYLIIGCCCSKLAGHLWMSSENIWFLDTGFLERDSFHKVSIPGVYWSLGKAIEDPCTGRCRESRNLIEDHRGHYLLVLDVCLGPSYVAIFTCGLLVLILSWD